MFFYHQNKDEAIFSTILLLDIVVNGYTSNKKNYKEWNTNEINLATLDDKGLNTLFCAINQEQFNHISCCSISHET